MASPALRPRGVGEILDLGFQLYRQRWVQMVTATLVLLLPILVLELVAPLEYLPLLDRVSDIFFLAAGAAAVVIASGAYMGRDVSGMQAVRQAGRRLLSVWCSAFAQFILIGVGLMLLVIPGILALAYTFAMQQAVMIEGCSTDDAFRRSKDLADGYLKPILLTIVLSTVITVLAVLALDEILIRYVPDPRTQLVATQLVLVTLNPLMAAISTVMYYDLRIRKEAYDVTVATERLDTAAPVPAF